MTALRQVASRIIVAACVGFRLGFGLTEVSCVSIGPPALTASQSAGGVVSVETGLAVVDVALGHRICVLGREGNVRCGTLVTPFEEISLAGPAITLSAGHDATCALLANGDTVCWDCPKPAGNFTRDWTAPVRLPLPPMKQIAIGWDEGCGVTIAGDVQCWGSL